MNDTVVKLDGLIKKYDNRPVVDGLSLEIKEGGGFYKGDERLADVMGFGEENVFSFGFLKNGRLVKFGCNGEDKNFTDVYVSEGGLGALTFEFTKTSQDTNSVFAVKGFFAQDSLPIVYSVVPCLDILMTAYTGAGNNTPPDAPTYQQVPSASASTNVSSAQKA